MDHPNLIQLIFRWLHVIPAVIAVGGAFFIRFVLMPSAAEALDEASHKKLGPVLIRRWKKVVHSCIGLLLLSGFVNYLAFTRELHEGQGLYHMLFGVKFLLALGVFTLAILLTLPRPWPVPARKKMLLMLVLLTLAVILIGGYMKTMPVTAAAAIGGLIP